MVKINITDRIIVILSKYFSIIDVPAKVENPPEIVEDNPVPLPECNKTEKISDTDTIA